MFAVAATEAEGRREHYGILQLAEGNYKEQPVNWLYLTSCIRMGLSHVLYRLITDALLKRPEHKNLTWLKRVFLS